MSGIVKSIIAIVIFGLLIALVAFVQRRSKAADEVAEDDPNENEGSDTTSNVQYWIGYGVFGVLEFFAIMSLIAQLRG
jgi:MFS superfamily sulfate permease-like transporter